MASARMATALSDHEDITGQMAYGIYTTICLCFPLQDAASKSQITETLNQGLVRLSRDFPWLAGQVVRKESEAGRKPMPTIITLDKTIRMIVNDLTQQAEFPSMDTLREAQFPFSMLDGPSITSLSGAPFKMGSPEDPAPVFFLQANFINGGLLLNFSGEHNAMDGQGLGETIRLFSKACYNEAFTPEEILQGNRARDNVIPLLDQSTYKPGPELDHLIVKPKDSSLPVWDERPSKSTWVYVRFSSSSLSELKTLASSSGTTAADNSTQYITTNDAVSAFIWQCTSRARVSRLPPNSNTTFARAVDVRSSLSIPPFYLGNVTNHAYTTFPLSTLLESPLRSIALTIRRALNPSELSYAMRSLATHIAVSPDTSKIRFGADLELPKDIFFSSWARLPCYNLDFNLGLGFPESVRRPRFDAIEGLMYLLPMDRTGGIDAAICLRDEDLDKLRADQTFAQYGKWIG